MVGAVRVAFVSCALAAVVGVVGGVGGVACTPAPLPQSEQCDLYLACFVSDDDAVGYRKLAAARVDGQRLSCFAGFDGSDDEVDALLAPVERAYGDEGACWGQGYAGAGDDVDNAGDCKAHCVRELQGECARRAALPVELQACPDLGDVTDRLDKFCSDAQNQIADVDSCPLVAADDDGVGEGEGE